MKICTWNVLHRVHAENWRDPAIDKHPDEHARIDAIAARVSALARDFDLVALQEVSGDQLAAIRARIATQITTHRYRRTPKWKRPSETVLVDPNEYLVTIGAADFIESHTYERDDGKGYLAVAANGLLIVNTHVTYGDPAIAQLAQVAARCRTHAGCAVIVGDFNADRARVLEIGRAHV